MRCYLQYTLTRGINFWWAAGLDRPDVRICYSYGPKGNGAWGVYVIALLGLVPCLLLHLNKAPSSGFWQAAWFTSTLFGFGHTGNNGENWIGIFAAAFIGFVFCVSVWLTGSAWWAIGCHASWDWAETYFYGTADSGLVASRPPAQHDNRRQSAMERRNGRPRRQPAHHSYCAAHPALAGRHLSQAKTDAAFRARRHRAAGELKEVERYRAVALARSSL